MKAATKMQRISICQPSSANCINAKSHQPPTQNIESQLYQKFESMMNNKRRKYLKARLKYYYGKNFAVNYKDHFAFEEQWENKENNEEKQDLEHIQDSSLLQTFQYIIQIVVSVLTIWFSNIDFFVRNGARSPTYSYIFTIALAVQYTNFTLNLFKAIQSRTMKLSYSFLCTNLFIILLLISKLSQWESKNEWPWVIAEVSFVYLIYCKTSQIYHFIRLMRFAVYHEYQSKLFDLISTLIIIAHFIAIILHLSTKIDETQINWQSSLNIDLSNEFIVYLYAFYFGSTTIMTVGYGDISPKNPSEVIIVTLVEIFGIVMFAFIINEIGYSISSIRRKREQVERNLATMEKLKTHYKMNERLVSRAKSYLINHNPNVDKLLPEEQNSLLTKFNEELKNDIVKSNLTFIVKSSLFLIIRWSKTFQHALTNGLTHVLLSPNDRLSQPKGQERIYIIRSGKIDIFAKVNGSTKMKNLLKTLDIKAGKEISDNSYGYTAVISSKTARLYATAKDFVSAYFIKKQDFFLCIQHRVSDIQFYHELKNRIDLSECIEALQVPSCESSRNHYNPTKAVIIRKFSKSVRRNGRKSYFRNKRESFRGQRCVIDFQLRGMNNHSSSSLQSHTLLDERAGRQYKLCVSQTEPVRREPSRSQNMIELSEFKKVCIKAVDEAESAKEYLNYFPKSNMSEILRRYEREYLIARYHEKSMREVRKEMIKSLLSIKDRKSIANL